MGKKGSIKVKVKPVKVKAKPVVVVKPTSPVVVKHKHKPVVVVRNSKTYSNNRTRDIFKIIGIVLFVLFCSLIIFTLIKHRNAGMGKRK